MDVDNYSEAVKLLASLPEPPILWFGSAVSAYLPPKLPSVDAATDVTLQAVGEALETGSYVERLASKYAFELSRRKDTQSPGQYAVLRQQIKFEEFFEKVEVHTGKDSVKQLMRCMYSVTGGMGCLNHQAIAHLLTSNTIQGCITTNFDNLLEMADPSIRDLRMLEPRDHVTDPFYLKVHGCVEEEVYVNTHRRMMEMRSPELRKSLLAMIEGKTVIVIGYSSHGDIDISPILKEAAEHYRTKFIWGYYSSSNDRPKFAEIGFKYNAGVDGDANVIVQFARSQGWTAPLPEGIHEWHECVYSWARQVPKECLVDLVASAFVEKQELPRLHITYVRQLVETANANTNHWNLAEALAGCGYYRLAQKMLCRVSDSGVSEFREAHVKGLTQWRMRKLDAAITILGNHLDSADDGSVDYRDVLRIYLEVTNDKLATVRSKAKRGRLAFSLRCTEVVKRLEEIDQIRPRSLYTTGLAIMRYKWLIGGLTSCEYKGYIEDEVFRKLVDTMMFGEASIAALYMLEVDETAARHLAGEILKKIRDEKNGPAEKRCLFIIGSRIFLDKRIAIGMYSMLRQIMDSLTSLRSVGTFKSWQRDAADGKMRIV